MKKALIYKQLPNFGDLRQASNMTKETQSSQTDDGTDWNLSAPTIHLVIVNDVRPSDAAYQVQTRRTKYIQLKLVLLGDSPRLCPIQENREYETSASLLRRASLFKISGVEQSDT